MAGIEGWAVEGLQNNKFDSTSRASSVPPWWRRWCRWLRRRWRRWSTLWNPGILKMTGHSFRLSLTIVFLSPGNFLNKPGLLSFFFPHHLGLLLLDGLEGNPSKRSSRSPGMEAATWKEYDFYQQGWSIFNSNNIWNWCQEYKSTMLDKKNMAGNGLVAAPYLH